MELTLDINPDMFNKKMINFQKNYMQKQILNMIDYLFEEAYLSDISLKEENYEPFFRILYNIIKDRGFETFYSSITRNYICDTLSKFNNLEEFGIEQLIQNLDFLKIQNKNVEIDKNKVKQKLRSSIDRK